MSVDPKIHLTVRSTLSGQEAGQIILSVDNQDPVDSLISQFCIDKGIKHKPDYVLRNNRNILLDNAKSILSYTINDGDILYLGFKDEEEKTFGCNNWWILAVTTLFVGGAGIIAVSFMYSMNGSRIFDYGIIFDAGSSHTDMFIYKWDGAKVNNTGEVSQLYKKNCSDTGIATFGDKLPELKEKIRACLKLAEEQIPKNHHEKSPLFLGATAGMRLLEKKNKSISEEILKAIQEEMASSLFQFNSSQARIISGEEEGIGSWVTANFLKGSLEKQNVGVIGALDLGGASTQITFEPKSIIKDFQMVRLYGWNHTIYSHSYLCYGKDEVERRMLANLAQSHLNLSNIVECHCCPKHKTFTRTSNYLFDQVCTSSKFAEEAWGSSVQSELDYENVTFSGTSNGKQCLSEVKMLFNGSFDQPKLSGNFVAFSGFFYVALFFNVTNNTALETFNNTVTDFCSKSWEEINATKVRNINDLIFYCFHGLYMIKLLDKYAFNTEDLWQAINFSLKINSQSLGWTLGFMLNATNTIPVDNPTDFITEATFIALAVLFIACIILAIIFACYARNQQSKTSSYRRLKAYGAI